MSQSANGGDIMEKFKAKGFVEVPKGINAIFLLETKADADLLIDLLKERNDSTFMVIKGTLKLALRKDIWEVIES